MTLNEATTTWPPTWEVVRFGWCNYAVGRRGRNNVAVHGYGFFYRNENGVVEFFWREKTAQAVADQMNAKENLTND